MAKSKVERGFGQIACKSKTTVLWKIHNYSSLTTIEDKQYNSSSFYFLDAKWYLRLFPNGESKYRSVGCTGLYLTKQHSTTKAHDINYTIGILDCDDNVYHWWNGKNLFDGNESGFGNPVFIQNSTILKNAHKIAPNNIVTFFCALCSKDYVLEPFSGISEDLVQRLKEDFGHTDAWNDQTAEKNCTCEEGKSDDEKEILYDPLNVMSICHDMKNLLLSERLCDVTFLFKSGELRAHKSILAARSPVFSAMFEHEMAEKKSGVVEISDCESNVFREFLLYLYTGKIEEVSLKNVCEVYMLADKYDVQQLKKMCVATLSCGISVDNFCDVISLAIKYRESELLNTATDYFAKKAKMILQTVEWQYFMAEAPTVANELFLKTLSK